MAHVLVIDDDPLFREIAQEMLQQAGHAVTQANDGAHVPGLPAAPAPDVAVVDMLMPERDGIETIGDLAVRWPGIKMIAVSAGAKHLESSLLLRAAMALGAHATLAKPLERETFLALVGSMLG